MATRWLTVHDALILTMRTLWFGVEVYDGRAVTGDAPTDFVTVGYVQDEVSGGDFTHEPHSGGWGTRETGSVRGELVVFDGDAGQIASLRARAFARMDELEAVIRADQTFGGVLPPGSTSRLTVDVMPSQTSAGAAQRLVFSLEYETTTDD